jgi:hypothetical protein
MTKPATGVEGCLIRGIDGEYYFRVYDADHNFQDYDLMHSDLSITITDPDAFFTMMNSLLGWITHLQHWESTVRANCSR